MCAQSMRCRKTIFSMWAATSRTKTFPRSSTLTPACAARRRYCWRERRIRATRRRATASRCSALRGRVRFLGTIPEADLPFLYGNARAFVFPSAYEGFGLPPLEAMACRTPVACSDIPSLREVAGDAALFFDASSTASISAVLESVLEDEGLRAGLRIRGLERAARMTWDLAAQKTLEVYGSGLS